MVMNNAGNPTACRECSSRRQGRVKGYACGLQTGSRRYARCEVVGYRRKKVGRQH